MSLTLRLARPVKREAGSPRDERLFLIACDDRYAPVQYFAWFRLPRVKVHVIPTEDGSSSAWHVLARLYPYETYPDDERWLLLDTDHYIERQHQQSFQTAVTDARQRGVRVAVSRPCFEFWLLLHHSSPADLPSANTAKDVEALLRTSLGGYNKTRLREDDFPITAKIAAIERAREVDAPITSGDIPDRNTTRVYKLVESIIRSSPRSTLPREFQQWLGHAQ